MARRILLADDSVTAQNMGRRILHDAGYDVVTVNNGSAALKKVAEQKPDLIILDVYMPGYGGLEVCSRLKENRETQRIPVLLTVGKLEPFKPEEARRVRADAYIVKPFEASELLASLTKLEDKIVPGPEPAKPGRFAKAMASVEASQEKDFGDKETGWKERLIIPGRKGKKPQSEPEPEAMPAKESPAAVRGEDFRPANPKAGFERPIPGGLPQDISAEEIAAIAAAAAKISNTAAESAAPVHTEEKPAEIKAETSSPEATPVEAAVVPETVPGSFPQPPSDPSPEEMPTATFASAPEVEEAIARPEETATSVPAAAEQSPITEAKSEAPAIDEVKPVPVAEDAVAKEEKHPASDAEVLAALAALTPAGGDFSAPAETHTDSIAKAAEGASFTGPRWVAEAVAVSEEESTFLLEHEMEKAYAAFAAAEAGRALLAQPIEASIPHNGNGHGSTDSSTTEHAASTQPETKPEEPGAAASEPVTQPVADAVATEAVQPEPAEAALAAAASAGAGAAEAVVSEPQAISSASPNVSAGGTEEPSGLGEAELAAAWANWRNIRESIVGTEPTIGAEPVPEEKHEEKRGEEQIPAVVEQAHEEPIAAAPAATEEPKNETANSLEAGNEVKIEAPQAAPEQDPAEISSIVDNMLAELKPKLMEELKRKLGK